MYWIRMGFSPIALAQVASTATGSVPMAMNPACRGFPMIGPSPSIPTTASTIVSPGRMVAARSTMDWWMPWK